VALLNVGEEQLWQGAVQLVVMARVQCTLLWQVFKLSTALVAWLNVGEEQLWLCLCPLTIIGIQRLQYGSKYVGLGTIVGIHCSEYDRANMAEPGSKKFPATANRPML
jgi:hypothetical protein